MKLYRRSKNWIKLMYWLIIIILWLGQALYTFRSTNQIRFEELSESVRNPFWLQNQTIYDGYSSNVGWYGTVLLFYNLFGFNLYAAKIIRLGLQLLSLLSLAALLKKYLGPKKAWLPLITIGLSPTFLFFNILQTSYGVDLQYFPICLYLIASLDFSRPKLAFVKQIAGWVLTMIASMSFPSFLVYLPILGLIYFYKLWQIQKTRSALYICKNIFLSGISFIAPLSLVLIYLKEPELLIYDEKLNSGIFRGGGSLPPLTQIPNTIFCGIKHTLIDLFTNAHSYYFELIRVEFSHSISAISVTIILLISLLIIIKQQQKQWLAILAWLLLILGLVVGNLADWFQGLRRTTAALAAFYMLYIVVWKFATQSRSRINFLLNLLAVSSCLIITLHHLKVYPNNLAGLVFSSPHKEDDCFNVIPDSPSQSLAVFVERIKKNPKLEMIDLKGNPLDCRLLEIYAAVAGSCQWNNLGCPEILGFDEKTQKYIPLTTELWENYYFQH